MKIKDFFRENLVFVDKKYKDKNSALKDLSNILVKNKYGSDSEKILELALKREGEFSTAIGNSIAIPHIRNDVMKDSVVTFVKTKDVDWQSIDGKPINYIFFITMSASGGESSHMEVIGELSRLFMNQSFINELKDVKDYKTLIKLVDKFSEEKNETNNSEQKTESQSEGKSESYDVVAVTACPTGIAHTFMAAQRLEDAGKEMGVKIKVETQGTDGPKNVITQDEIKNAKGVIIAVDKVVDLSRFAGKENVLEMGTKTVINDPNKQITRILNNEGKKMEGSSKAAKGDELGSDDMMSFKGFHKRLYKGVMNGISYMLPFVVFGGILIAVSYLIDINNAGNKNYGSINGVAHWFNALGNLAFGLLVPILCAYISFGLVGKFGLLPGFICGMISAGRFLFKIDITTFKIDWLGSYSLDDDSKVSSGFFGGIAGAFLTAALIIVFVKYVFAWLPKSMMGIKNILLIPLFGTLTIAATFWILNIPLIFLNYGFQKFLELMADKAYLSALLGLIIGGMMAFDLGGPINKAAYLFSMTTIQSGSSGTVAMAASMGSGMVPPLAIALCTTIFRKIWTKEERDTGTTLYIMGLSFVSEGAIPFTAKNPKVLVPANVIGGALAGLLIGALQITLQAPHGGIFVFALVKTTLFGNSAAASVQIGAGIALYILAILVGAVAEMFAIVLFRKVFDKNKEKTSNKKNKKPKKSFIKQIKFKSFSKNKTSLFNLNKNKITHINFI